MTTIEETFVARLLATSAVTALVGTRIEPVINAQDTDLPALSYQAISRISEDTHDGPGFRVPRIQLTAIGTTYSSVVGVLEACKTVLDAKAWGDGNASFVENEFDGYAQQADVKGLFVRRMDVVVYDP